eukprot:TRINITY_DN21857_c1_g1_i3.p1 TRINITY_DN21857_c1_g1~~TRINITY_DN21857_c1_g1_i3.p1  ORF type:complete len:991 (-),score=124.38 TRINITY_DN21857_c1_g1_i3:180-3152(-)
MLGVTCADFDGAAFGPACLTFDRGTRLLRLRCLDCDNGWALGRILLGPDGWFPADHVEAPGEAACADFDGAGFGSSFLSFTRGARIIVVARQATWALGALIGREGWFPSQYWTADVEVHNAKRSVTEQVTHDVISECGADFSDDVGDKRQLSPLLTPLLDSDAGHVISVYSTIVQKLKISCAEDVTEQPGGWGCKLTWSGREQVFGFGRNKKAARAEAARGMLLQAGHWHDRDGWRSDDERTVDASALRVDGKEVFGSTLPCRSVPTDHNHRLAATKIRNEAIIVDLGRARVRELAARGLELVSSATPDIWDIFLGRLCEAIIRWCDDIDATEFLHGLVKRNCGGRLQIVAWQAMLDAIGRIFNATTSGAGLEVLATTLLPSTASFPSYAQARAFCCFRVWLAREGRAELQQALDHQLTAMSESVSFKLVHRGQLEAATLRADCRDSTKPEANSYVLVSSRFDKDGRCRLARVTSSKVGDGAQTVNIRLVSVDSDWISKIETWTRDGEFLSVRPISAFGVTCQRMADALLKATTRSSSTSGVEQGFTFEMCSWLFQMSLGDLPEVTSSPQMGTLSPLSSFSTPTRGHCLAAIGNGLTPAQNRALSLALESRVTLVHGPPGTGKTCTAVRIVEMWKGAFKGKVLCCADSNAAADRLVQALSARGMQCVRLGHSGDAGRDYERSKDFWLRMRKALEKCDVAVGTSSSSGHAVTQRFCFPSVIVDECTQAVMPSTLVPLSLGAERTALLGDHMQLPPTILDEGAAREGFSRSLFERLISNRSDWSVLLDEQRRMHPSLMHFASEEFYEGHVKSHTSCSQLSPVDGLVWPATDARVWCVNVCGSEENFGVSHRNIAEVDAVMQLLQRVSLKPAEIGIITPYQAQKTLLRNRLRKAACNDCVAVDTVDGFQGSERELIIFSAVRSNSDGRIGFVADRRRMNVALTRARRGLVVFASVKTLASPHTAKAAPAWHRWLTWADKIGAVAPNVEHIFRT